MIKVKQILKAVRRGSCDNCNREMPMFIQYSFCNEKGKEYNKISLCEDCGCAVSYLFFKVMEEGKSFIYDKDEIKESEEMQMKDKTINLCDTCRFEIPSCKATEEGVDFKFGHGLGNDNVYECKIYEPKNKEEI